MPSASIISTCFFECAEVFSHLFPPGGCYTKARNKTALYEFHRVLFFIFWIYSNLNAILLKRGVFYESIQHCFIATSARTNA